MAVILSLAANFPAIAAWRPLYLLLTVIIVFSQKVDTTLSKGILRLVATLVGGAYGMWVCTGQLSIVSKLLTVLACCLCQINSHIRSSPAA